MAAEPRLICAGAQLVEACKGVRFEVPWGTKSLACFAVRYGGKVRAYLNCCPHQGTELDWLEGHFFDESAIYLICATHGATFFPDTGLCCAGPCKGQSLMPVQVEERDGMIYWKV